MEKLKLSVEWKSRQTAENKQTFDLSRKIDIEGKSRQTVENKQTFGIPQDFAAMFSFLQLGIYLTLTTTKFDIDTFPIRIYP